MHVTFDHPLYCYSFLITYIKNTFNTYLINFTMEFSNHCCSLSLQNFVLLASNKNKLWEENWISILSVEDPILLFLSSIIPILAMNFLQTNTNNKTTPPFCKLQQTKILIYDEYFICPTSTQ
jgi:hypothetical protein